MATKIPVLFALMSQRKITQKQLSLNIGVSEGNISDWKSGRAAPGIEILPKIAEYLECSIDYLLGRTDNPQVQKSVSSMSVGNVSNNSGAIGVGNIVTNADSTSKEERELLRIYRDLNVRGRAKLLNTAFALEDENKKEEN